MLANVCYKRLFFLFLDICSSWTPYLINLYLGCWEMFDVVGFHLYFTLYTVSIEENLTSSVHKNIKFPNHDV